MTSIGALFTVSFGQALPLRRTIMLVLLELAPVTIYLLATSSRTSEAAFQGLVEIGASTFFALVLPVVAIVIAAGALGNERRDLTLSFIALRPLPRTGIAATKLAAAIAAAGVVNLVGAVALGVAHTVRYGGSGGVVVALIFGTVVATAAYASLFLPLGFLTDRAVIIGMGYLLVFENGVIFALSGLILLSPWRFGASVFADRLDGARIYLGDAVGSLSTGRVLITLAIYVAASLVGTTWLLRHRDLA
ncbi:MAG TPA: hypothetical protein VLA29_02005 [Acidimicrobiia bacterium]|nr:hypothetical protein [Acidimicrobiia bacterium]